MSLPDSVHWLEVTKLKEHIEDLERECSASVNRMLEMGGELRELRSENERLKATVAWLSGSDQAARTQERKKVFDRLLKSYNTLMSETPEPAGGGR